MCVVVQGRYSVLSTVLPRDNGLCEAVQLGLEPSTVPLDSADGKLHIIQRARTEIGLLCITVERRRE